ncbi:MAG: ABC transporter ATP-binding protein, partial [Veillonella sp.]|nr:ABC transporter ATP-binding protein [Veillonella sp.]
MSVLTVDNITVGYGKRLILENQSIVFDKPEIISIIGPNGSGKSTFLKALARLIKIKQGTISLDGKSLHSWNTKELARHIALLPQITTAPEGMLVEQ